MNRNELKKMICESIKHHILNLNEGIENEPTTNANQETFKRVNDPFSGKWQTAAYEVAFQLLGFPRFAFGSEVTNGKEMMENPWDDAYAIVEWVENNSQDPGLSKLNQIKAKLKDQSYCKDVMNGTQPLISIDDAKYLFQLIPQSMRESLKNDIVNASRIKQINDKLAEILTMNNGDNMTAFFKQLHMEMTGKPWKYSYIRDAVKNILNQKNALNEWTDSFGVNYYGNSDADPSAPWNESPNPDPETIYEEFNTTQFIFADAKNNMDENLLEVIEERSNELSNLPPVIFYYCEYYLDYDGNKSVDKEELCFKDGQKEIEVNQWMQQNQSLFSPEVYQILTEQFSNFLEGGLDPDEMQNYLNELRKITQTQQPMNEGRIAKIKDTHYAVNKQTGKIVYSWDYKGYDSEELRYFKRDYFSQDLIDNDLDPKNYTILTLNTCLRRGIDPNITSNWSNM